MNKTEVVYKGSEGKGIEKLAISLGVPQFNLSLKSYCGAAGTFGFEITLEGIKLLVHVWWFLPFKNLNHVCHYAIATSMTVDLPTNTCALKAGLIEVIL